MDWQGIGTAPRTSKNKPVLVTWEGKGNRVFIAYRRAGEWWDQEGRAINRPTLWQPCPTSPLKQRGRKR